MGHVPWLGSIALSLPGFANNTKVFCAHAKNWARRRVKEGSVHKDLFYHLVRLNFQPDHQYFFKTIFSPPQIDEDNLATFRPTMAEVTGDGM